MAQPISDFTSSAEGWGTVGRCPSESSPGVTWSASGGNPGGRIYGTDNSIGHFYWNATGTEWKNDLSAYYGCNLYYECKTTDISNPQNVPYDILIIRGDDYVISYNTPYNPGLSWTSYAIPLSETGWIVEGLFNSDATCPNLAGTPATMADMLSYLGDVKRIRIRAEYSGLSEETNSLDNVQIICDPIGLSVEMEQFEVHDIGNGRAQLDWTTASESENRYFQVEKSTNGVVFDSIGIVIGNGNSLEPNYYTFRDNAFTQDAYFRLKTVDYSNLGNYSDVQFLKRSEPELSTLRVDPNPATTSAQLLIGEPGMVYRWDILDLSGRVITGAQIDAYNGWYSTGLDFTGWSSGVYIIKIATDHGLITSRFQVVN